MNELLLEITFWGCIVLVGGLIGYGIIFWIRSDFKRMSKNQETPPCVECKHCEKRLQRSESDIDYPTKYHCIHPDYVKTVEWRDNVTGKIETRTYYETGHDYNDCYIIRDDYCKGWKFEQK